MANAPLGNTTSNAKSLPAAPLALVAAVVALFFIWGGLTSLNDIIIPKLKGLFQLSFTEAMLIQFAFFTAYAFVSVPAGTVVARLGYGKGIVLGLAIMAVGCLLFIPAANTATYAIFLGALFILASGITILQVAANPLIANLGSPETSHGRLTFAQAFNSLGTTIFPYVGSALILGSISDVDPSSLSGEALIAFQKVEAAVISKAYIGLAAAMIVIALFFWFIRKRLGEPSTTTPSMGGSFGLLRRPRLGFGVASIFLYVGAEVTIGSFIVNFLTQSAILGIDEQGAGKLVALYWGGAMFGRLIGSLLMLWRVISPGKLLSLVAIGAVILLAVAGTASGPTAGYALLAIGLMNSIMFPTIFSLAVEGLGGKTPQGSGLLCMAIVGGALVPLLGGKIADISSIAVALIVPAVCYGLIGLYGWSARKAAVSLEEADAAKVIQ